MEALLEKEGQVESWNDDRMDELSRRMDAGFSEAATKAGINRRFDEAHRAMKERFEEVYRDSGEVKRELHRVNDRLDKLFYGVGFIGLTLGLNLMADKL
jgi:hypothetical protein